MHELLMLATAGALIYLGMSCLALAQDRHWEAVRGEVRTLQTTPPRSTVKRLRMLASVLMALGAGVLWWRDGPAFGCVMVLLMLTACAVAVALTLTWRPQALRMLLRCAPV